MSDIDFVDREVSMMLAVLSKSLNEDMVRSRDDGMIDIGELEKFYETKISAVLKLAEAQSDVSFEYWNRRVAYWMMGLKHFDDVVD